MAFRMISVGQKVVKFNRYRHQQGSRFPGAAFTHPSSRSYYHSNEALKPSEPEPEPELINADGSYPFHLYSKSQIVNIFSRYAPQLDHRPFVAAAEVFPMRVNNYVVENLIDWSNVPHDPIFKLVFPQPEMLLPEQLDRVRSSRTRLSPPQRQKLAEEIRATLNPHPAGQKEENVPMLDGISVEGMQHKYRETVLFFPMEGQFCHSFCTYCFRWAQFTSVGSDQQFKSKDQEALKHYLASHPFVKDLLFTGGDPMVMNSRTFARYVTPLLNNPETQHLQTIRIGTKSLAYWPYRYTHDSDAKALLNMFERIVNSGKHLSIQAHFSHPKELQTPQVQEAMKLIQMTGAVIRCQSPLIRHVNDSAETWSTMWNLQTRLGAIPYYMFVERDTGARDYFSVPLAKAYEIFNGAYAKLAGTARTVRGPSMSAGPGKIGLVGISTIHGEKVFVLKFLQARNPKWLGETFFAKFDPQANWLNDLKPAFGEKEFFFEPEYNDTSKNYPGSSGQRTYQCS
ncbi:Uncharacterized protein BP5553_06791 [Venustampulla echinocandica]|uniref:L-lysine 2,3-aminomutase n=1 Tax=Venustampulla echinocandica TaxID=2656787 RepID=A0A370TKX9_9HELO|nr:Uncharacterized protein BP5553_06791 [Venustampulla echinocandica]RDL36179.1 Uncharacterized protein BP5553_06791 [Venustampulla echinocandica]